VEIENIVSRLEFGLEIIAVFLFGNCAGGRKNSSAKAIIEGVGVEFLEIYIRVCSFTVDAIGHTDELAAQFLTVLKIEIAIRVYEIG
jgi:predicted metal-binding protein